MRKINEKELREILRIPSNEYRHIFIGDKLKKLLDSSYFVQLEKYGFRYDPALSSQNEKRRPFSVHGNITFICIKNGSLIAETYSLQPKQSAVTSDDPQFQDYFIEISPAPHTTKQITGPNLQSLKFFERKSDKKLFVLSEKNFTHPIPFEDFLKQSKTKAADIYMKLVEVGEIKPQEDLYDLEFLYDKEKDKIYLPPLNQIIPSFDYFSLLKDSIAINYDLETARKEYDLIMKTLYPKERADFFADAFIFLSNLIIYFFKLPKTKRLILSYGEENAGKSSLHRLAFKFWFGSDFQAPESALSGSFRPEVMFSTNYPLFFDDIGKWSKKLPPLLKTISTGDNIFALRGKSNLTTTQWELKYSTWVFTSNADPFESLSELKEYASLKRRFYINHYTPEDKEQLSPFFDSLLSKITTSGFIFEIFDKYKASELKEKLEKYYQEKGDTIEAVFDFGKEILTEIGFQIPEYTIEREELEREWAIYRAARDDAKRVKEYLEQKNNLKYRDKDLERLKNCIYTDGNILIIVKEWLLYGESTPGHVLHKYRVSSLAYLEGLKVLFPAPLLEAKGISKIYTKRTFPATKTKVWTITLPYLNEDLSQIRDEEDQEKEEKVLAAIKENKELSLNNLQKMFDFSLDYLTNILDKLQAKGVIKKETRTTLEGEELWFKFNITKIIKEKFEERKAIERKEVPQLLQELKISQEEFDSAIGELLLQGVIYYDGESWKVKPEEVIL